MTHDDKLTTFGARLGLAMFNSGIRKNTDMARRVGIAEGTIRNWLTRVLPPSGKDAVLAKIAEALNVSLSWLQFGIGPMQMSAQETINSYTTDGDLTPAQRIVLRTIRADVARLSDKELETWFSRYQYVMNKAR